MAMQCIDDQYLTSLQSFYKVTKQNLHQSSATLHSMQYTSLASEVKMVNSLYQLHTSCTALETKLNQIHTFMLESITAYQQVDKQMLQLLSSFSLPQIQTIMQTKEANQSNKQGTPSPLHTEVLRTSGHLDNIFDLKKVLSIFKKNGGIEGEFILDVLAATYQKKFNKLSIFGDVSVGHAEVNAKARIAIDKKDLLSSALEVNVGAKASLAQGVIRMLYQQDHVSMNVEASGEVGVAEAKAEASISKKGVHIEGEVGVAAAKGKVSGTINIFGIKITATAHGEAGAFGAGGVFKTESNSFQIGAKASCIFGGGFDFKVDW